MGLQKLGKKQCLDQTSQRDICSQHDLPGHRQIIGTRIKRITKTYQEYSNRDNAVSINNALKFARTI